jgi:hypothetical protein
MRSSFNRLRWLAALALASTPAYSADFTLPTIDLSDFDKLVNEFSANSQYSTVTPASSLGGLWGFEFGLVGGMTKAPDTLALVKRSDPNTSIKDNLYHAGALVRLGLPFGFTAEGLYLPEIKAASVKLKRWGLGAQWTITDAILEDFPVHLAVKGYLTKTQLKYSQNITSNGITAPATINFDNTLWGLQALVSYQILVFEPYAGLGWTSAKGQLDVDATANVSILNFGSQGIALNKSASSKPTSAQLIAGLDVRLAFFSLGAEYVRGFGKQSYNGRLSFRF